MSEYESVESKLSRLKAIDIDLERVYLKRESLIETFLGEEVAKKLREIDDEMELEVQKVDTARHMLEVEIKQDVLRLGESVSGEYAAVYNKGRISWNNEAMEGYAAAHPEVLQFRKVGKPSVSIRRK